MRYWLVKGIDFREDLGTKEIIGFRVDILWKEGEKGAHPALPELFSDFIYLISHGEVNLVSNPGTSQALTLANLKPGDIFGVSWKADNRPDPFLMIPAGEPEIYQIEPEEAGRLIEDIKIKVKIRKGFKRMELTQSVGELIRVGPTPRVAALFLKLGRGFGQEVGGRTRLFPVITPLVISELAGLSLELTVLVLAGLNREGIIEIKPEGIVIVDRIRLSFLSEAANSDSKGWP